MTQPARHARGTHTRTAAFAALLALFACAFAASAAKHPAKQTVRHGGASLSYDTALAREVTGETAPAAPLESADEKPDGVFPEHVAFKLIGVSGAPADSFNEPVVRVCPVVEYMKAFTASPRLVSDAGRTFAELRRLIRLRPSALKGNVPMLPFPDGTEVFHAHVKYLRFRGGSGVAFLTQGQQDYELINNQHVSYEFRGLTDDGRFYVSATFPTSASILPATREVYTHEGYTLPREIGGRLARQRYNAYVERVRRKLERLRPEQFQPDLRLYDDMLSSLEINK